MTADTTPSTTGRLRFGAFVAPFHRLGENPTLAVERDLALVEHLDLLGYDEVWIGEHHSAGWELISSPEVFLAAAAQRTRTIGLGTGVVSLPYHHPLNVADRIVLVDHLSRGRALLGVGPGALPSDAAMMGIESTRQRDMMDEALGVILGLLRGETVTHETDWFTLRDAQLHMRPYSNDIPVAVASMFSPAGMKAAGRHGVGVLSLGAWMPNGVVNQTEQWEIAEIYAGEQGQVLDRGKWGLLLPVHIAPTREQAFAEATEHLRGWLDYFGYAMGRPLPIPTDLPPLMIAEGMMASGGAIIGTPDDAIEAIRKMHDVTGGFGSLLCLAHEWTSFENVKRSFELIARYVVPEFTGVLAAPRRSMQWVREHYGDLQKRYESAFSKAVADHRAHVEETAEPGTSARGG